MSKKNFTMYLDEKAVEATKDHIKRNGGSLGGKVSDALIKEYYIEPDEINMDLNHKKTRREKYHDYLKSDAWLNLREFAKFKNKRKNGGILTCEDCGKSNTNLFNVHHNEYPERLEDDNPKYHVVLCERCHKIRHDLIELSEEEQLQHREDFRISMEALIIKHNKKKAKKNECK